MSGQAANNLIVAVKVECTTYSKDGEVRLMDRERPDANSPAHLALDEVGPSQQWDKLRDTDHVKNR